MTDRSPQSVRDRPLWTVMRSMRLPGGSRLGSRPFAPYPVRVPRQAGAQASSVADAADVGGGEGVRSDKVASLSLLSARRRWAG